MVPKNTLLETLRKIAMLDLELYLPIAIEAIVDADILVRIHQRKA